MGTRAFIKYEGKPVLATHWDGYPSGLGAELVKIKDKTPENIIKVASHHNIDFISPKYAPNKPLVIKKKVYSGKGKYVQGEMVTEFLTEKEMDKRGIEGTYIPAKGKTERKYSTIIPVSMYDDFVEWEYNIKGNKVYARRLLGSYKEKRPYTDWTLLKTPSFAKKFEDKIRNKRNKEYTDEQLRKARKNPEFGVAKIMQEMASSSSYKLDDKNAIKGYPTIHSYKEKLTTEEKKEIKSYLKIPKVRNRILGKGWFFESVRHRLARYGIKTSRKR